MKQIIIAIFFSLLLFHAAAYGDTDPAPNGISIPDGYKNWKVIAPSYRSDNNTLRVILGNDIAIKATEKNETNPWPDGSVIAKIVWKAEKHEDWQSASIPGEFVHSEFMFKDSKKHPDTGDWGFARWIGLEQRPYGKDKSFEQECFGCHMPVKDNDYMFTVPAQIP